VPGRFLGARLYPMPLSRFGLSPIAPDQTEVK
jgi:hypothetical protein